MDQIKRFVKYNCNLRTFYGGNFCTLESHSFGVHLMQICFSTILVKKKKKDTKNFKVSFRGGYPFGNLIIPVFENTNTK